MLRRLAPPILQAIAFCLGFAGCGALRGRPSPSAQPNMLLYVVDTLRADSLSAYGNPVIHTPHFDRFARQGALYESAYAQAPWTRASMASLFTALYPATHGVTDRLDALPHALPLLPELLQGHGYRTAYVMTNPNAGAAFGFGRGFDEVVEMYGHPEDRWAEDRDLIATADAVTEAARAFIATAPQPFFLLAFTIDPHYPYNPPSAFDLYASSCRGSTTARSIPGDIYAGPERDRMRSLYYGEIAWNDLELGRLLAALSRAGRSQDTLVLFTADHGEEFWEHGLLGHGKAVYEESVHVPLSIRYRPAFAPGLAHRLAQTVDIAPTLLQLAHLQPPARADGKSLLATRASEESVAYTGLSFESRDRVALLAPPSKLIWDLKTGERLVFDLDQDAREDLGLPIQGNWRGERLQERLDGLIRQGSQRRRELHLCHESLQEEDLAADLKQSLRALGYLD